LQLYVEITAAGGVLKPPPGRYAGPVIIKKPITIDGAGKVVIDGGGKGTVISVKADNTVLRGLHITHSGGSHDAVDAAILVEANDSVIENNVLDEVLFGIYLKKADGNTVRGNRISSLERDISIRGDGIKMWYSNENRIENNILDRVRDFASNNSLDNKIIGNTIKNSRVGMEFIYSHGNEVAKNTISNDVTGIVLIYSNALNIHDNRISHMRKLVGAGLSFKESAEVLVKNNEIAHCAVGLQANSPLDPTNRMIAEENLFTYNVLGLYFYGEKGGHIIRHNHFENNFTDVLGSASMTVRDNVWDGNYWDRYRGFDRNEDGIGDKPHDVFLYSERIWADNSKAKFFRGSPAMGMLDLSFRLAPFSRPKLQYSDPHPRMNK
jgi:nitrous oxidase accessory protein